MLLPIEAIEEDASQPRLEFEEEPLRELAETIARIGVKQPVSVRPKAEAAGRWVLNFGARRLRASKLAGKTEIPAFVDESFDSYDQMIENGQREALKPLEVALFVQRRLAAGETQADIARHLGKSRGYVTFATALIDAPDWLLELYRGGRCTGMQELYTLRQLHEQHSGPVESLCADSEPITRDRLASFRSALLAHSPSISSTDVVSVAPPVMGAVDAGRLAADAFATTGEPTSSRQRSSIVVAVEHQGMPAELVLDATPRHEDEVYIRAAPAGARFSVPVSSVVVKAIFRR
jgi:ParB family chromosome partitioning protein